MEGPPLENAFSYVEVVTLVNNLQSQLAASHNTVLQQTAHINNLNEEIRHLSIVAPPTSIVAPPHGPQPHYGLLPKGFKTPTLDPFTGLKGEDLDAWLFQAKEQFDLLGISDDYTKILISGQVFKKHAKTWYMSVRGPHVPEDEKIVNWDEFVTALREHFSPVAAFKIARDELAVLKQLGSVRDYTAKFRQLCSIIQKISDDEKLDRYVRGLKYKIQKEVNLKSPATFLEATQMAEKLDISFDRVYHMADERPRQYDRSSRPIPMDIDNMRVLAMQNNNYRERSVQWADRQPRQPQSDRKFKRLTDAEKQGRRDRNECLYCGSKDHQLRFCPLNPRGPGNGNRRPHRDA